MKNPDLATYQENVQRLSGMIAKMSKPVSKEIVTKEFPLVDGKTKVWTLYSNDDVSIVKAFVTPNTQFPLHIHDVKEVIVLYSGSAVFTSGTVAKELKPGDFVGVDAGQPHDIKSGPEGAWFSVTTVPREEVFDGR